MKQKLFFFVISLFCFSYVLQAQVPQLINYQGVLIDPDSGERLSGTYAMTFSIYAEESGGSALWTETQDVIVQNGIFNVLLGSITDLTLDLFDGTSRYLGVQVGSDAEMTPRKQLVSVVYAFKSHNTDKFSGLDTSNFVKSGQENSISTDMIQDDAVTAEKIQPKVVSSINNVSNDGGNINLEAGANVTITPDDANNKITIAAETGAGDNLGNHIATQNIQLNHHWLSGDGGNEGIYVNNTSGKVGIGTNNPQEKLDVAGTVRSSSGGFKFPDGSVQTTAFTGVSNAWKLTGNSGTNETDNFIGTTDDISLNFRVNNVRALKLSPNGISPNLIGGYKFNRTKSGVNGGVIGGGGFSSNENLVADHYGTVSGGADNQAGSDDADRTNSEYATVGGGIGNKAKAENATIAGGYHNTVSGDYSSIGGGAANAVSGEYATIPGGERNEASGNNSFAAGTWAKAKHDGAFVWADKHAQAFESTGENQFLIRADGGVGIGTNSPQAKLDVNGEVKADSMNTTDLNVTGAYKGNIGPNGGAPFPRPAYDSGWVSITAGQAITLTHNVGGNADDYFIDFQMKGNRHQIHNIYNGAEKEYNGHRNVQYGVYYQSLTNTSIVIARAAEDAWTDYFRIRIWVCK